MVQLLEDMMDISRIETGLRLDLTLQSVDLAAVVDEAVSSVTRPAHVRLSVDVPPGLRVWSDPFALERALVNLLRNAFRYGGPNVSIAAAPSIGGAILSVNDDGPGVAPDLARQLFEPFKASRGGTGLGLAIVKAVAEASGGSVAHEPERPTGARFTLRLREDAPPAPEAAPSATRDADTAQTVLIVDDEPDVLFLLRLTLEHAGYQVEEAAHGGMALELVERIRPDLVITDLMMPVVDGRELIRRLRESDGTASVPIMLLSASPDSDSGADRVVRKPFDPRHLMRTIDELVGGAR